MPTAAQTRAIKAEQQEAAKLNILQTMADYGNAGRSDFTTKSPIARHETPKGKVSIPIDMDLDDAERQINQERKVQNATTGVQHDFACRREEGAIAIKRILENIFGSTGLPLRETMWGDFVPPQERIQVDIDEWGDPVYESAPMYSFSLPLIETEFGLDVWEDDNQTEMLRIRAETKVSHKPAIDGFCRMVEDELKRNSIYKNKVLSYKGLPDGTYKLEYLHRQEDPIFTYSRAVTDRLEDDVWNILRYGAAYPADLQRTFKVLLHGPLGTGKTGAVTATEIMARTHGQTVIEYSPSGLPSVRDLGRCMSLAKRLGPTLIAVEDYEKFSSADLSAADRSALTNLIDGADKRDQISMVMTTNYVERIDEALVRGQRMTGVIEIGMLDREGTEILLKKAFGDQLDPETDFDAVWQATENYGPSFLTTCFTKARQISAGRHNGDHTVQIGTEGIVGAAEALRDQRNLHQKLVDAKAEKKPGFRELFTGWAFSWVKEFGPKLRLTQKGFSVSE